MLTDKAQELIPEPTIDTNIIAEFEEYFQNRLFLCTIKRDVKSGKKNVSFPQGWNNDSEDFIDLNFAGANSYAIRTGNGLVVIDVDTKELNNLESNIEELVDKWLKDKSTFIVETTNGYHFYFDSSDKTFASSVRVSPFVDIRGDGGCVFCYTEDKHSSYNILSSKEPLPLTDELLKYLEHKNPTSVEYFIDDDKRFTMKNGKDNPALKDAVNSADINRIIKASSSSFSIDDFTKDSDGLYTKVNKFIYIIALNPSVPNDAVENIVKMLVDKIGYVWDSEETQKRLKQIYSTLIWTDESKLDEEDIFANAYKEPEELNKMIVDSVPIIGKFVLKGQMTFLYGPPNVGKTILMMALLKDVKQDIVYLNADDGINGGTEKVKIAKDNGYMMVLCGTDNNNDTKVLLSKIEEKLSRNKNYYKNKIIIFDTVKKFVAPLDKKDTSIFLQLMRKITLSGGTIVLLGHTNKHRQDNELVFEGVGDWTSDMDCVYGLDFEYDESNNEKTVIFDNKKSRGSVPQTVSYKYYAGKELDNYIDRIESVEEVSNEQAEYLQEQSRLRQLESKHEDALHFIVAILKKHTYLTQKAIRDKAKEDEDLDISDKEIRNCLKAFEGTKWKVKTNKNKNNAKEYSLIVDPIKSEILEYL